MYCMCFSIILLYHWLKISQKTVDQPVKLKILLGETTAARPGFRSQGAVQGQYASYFKGAFPPTLKVEITLHLGVMEFIFFRGV